MIPLALRSPTARQLAAFTSVGLVGFAVDGAVLSLLVWEGIGIYAARGISFSLACAATWAVNRRLTFRASVGHGGKGREYLRYYLVQVIGATVNLGVFSFAIALHPQLARSPMVPLAMGAAVALMFNFLGAKLWVYR